MATEYRAVHESILKRQIYDLVVPIPAAAQPVSVKTSGTLR
jgi:hypothetical protein